MKYLNRIKSLIVILLFVVIVAFPYYATIFHIEGKLTGAIEKVEFSFENIDDYVIQNFPGRATLLKAKNSFLYNYFDISPNDSIVKIGDNLISTETLNYYYHDMYSLTDTEMEKLTTKFVKFNEFCKENNKKLLVIFTPTKLRYYSGVMPAVDYYISRYSDSHPNNGMKPYDILKMKLQKENINVFDSIEVIDKNRYKYLGGDVPLFYNSGHHWSNYKARLVALELHDYMRHTMDIKIPYLSTVATKSDVPMDPDADLFYVLNINDKPKEQFYAVTDNVENPESDNLNYMIQGGSFTAQMMFPPIAVSETKNTVQIVNKIAFYNNYEDKVEFETYEELDKKIGLLDRIKNTDVYIFEIHEVNVYNATFGFIDYLLDHREEL